MVQLVRVPVILGGPRERRVIDKDAVLEAIRMSDLDADEILLALIQRQGKYQGYCIFEALADQRINITRQ